MLGLVALPLAAAGLWLASGRETLSKRRRYVQVEVVDELFGDTRLETRARSGPIFGWYVGLDVVGVSVFAGTAGLITLWLVGRRGRDTRSQGS